MDNPVLFSMAIGVVATSIAMILYLKFFYSAKETEKKRVEMQQKKEEQMLKLKKLGWDDSFQEEAKKSGWDINMKEYLFISGGALFLMIILAIAMKNIFIAVGGGLIAYMLPKHLLKRARKQEYKLKVKLLKPALQAIASAHTYKPNIVSAIQHAVNSMQDPIRRHFEIFLMDVEMGLSLQEALNALKKRVNVKYLDFFIKVVQMAEEEGGKTHELIKTCAEIIDQDTLVMEEFEAEISSEKRTTFQLMFLQFVVLGFLSVAQPDAFHAYTGTLFGQAFIFYVMMSTFIVFSLLEKLTDTSLEEVNTS